MKLIKYELDKVWRNKRIVLLLFLFLILTGILFFVQQQNTREYSMIGMQESAYENFLEKYKNKNEENRNELEEIQVGSFDFTTYPWMDCELSEVYSYYAYATLQQYDYVDSYGVFIDEMEERSNKLNDVSIFSNENVFSSRSIDKTVQDFSKLKNCKIAVDNNVGLIAVLKNRTTDLLVMMFLLFVVATLFATERDQGLYGLLKSQKNGRTATILSKFGALFITMFCSTVVFYTMLFLVSSCLYGLGDLSRSIQSLETFRNCPYPWTAGQFLMMFVLTKVGLFSILSAFLAFLYIRCKNAISSVFVWSVCLIIEFVSYAFIGIQSPINYFKCMNIFYIADTEVFYGNYVNLNFFQQPVSHCITSLWIGIALLVLFIGCTTYHFCHHSLVKESSLIQVKVEQFLIRMNHGDTTNLLRQECYKLFWQQKMALILLLLGGICINQSMQDIDNTFAKADVASYYAYLSVLDGKLTDEKKEYIKEQEAYYEQMPEKQNKSDLEDERKKGFDRVLSQYEYLLSIQDKYEDVSFVNEDVYENYFDNRTDGYLSLGISFIFIILIMSQLLNQDYKNEMDHLIRVTHYGREKLFRTKLKIAVFTTVIVFVSQYADDYIVFFREHGFHGIGVDVHNIQAYAQMKDGISIGGIMAESLFIKLLFTCFLTMTCILVSTYVRNYMNTVLLLSSGVFLIGFFLYQYTSFELNTLLLYGTKNYIWFILTSIVISIGIGVELIATRRQCCK